LQTLNLRRNNIGAEGALVLSQSPYLSNLQTLNLSGNYIRAEGALALSQSPYLSNLQILDISYNGIGAKGAVALSESPYLSNLQTLDLSNYNGIGAKGALALSQSPYLSNLQTLYLCGNRIGAGGAKAFEKGRASRAAPREAFLGEEEAWRLLGYACLSEGEKAEFRGDFLKLARGYFEEEAEGMRWSWCLQHLLTWVGRALEEAIAAFPEVVALQERRDALQAQRERLEEPLF
jgi:hypothetical protein